MTSSSRDDGSLGKFLAFAGGAALFMFAWQYSGSNGSETYCTVGADCDQKAWETELWPLALRCRRGGVEAAAAADMVRFVRKDMQFFPPPGTNLRTQLDICLSNWPER